MKRPEIPSYFAPLALLRGQSSALCSLCFLLEKSFRVFRGPTLRPPPPSASPPSVLSVPSCQKSFRVFRVFRGPTIRRPSTVIRRLPSVADTPAARQPQT